MLSLDFVMGGMPRGGTTVAAKFISLDQDIFCYASETHLIPLMHTMFGLLPCRDDKLDLVIKFLHQQFQTAMVEMPAFNVSQGAHPGNLIFSNTHVNVLVEEVGSNLQAQLYGIDLYQAALTTLRNVISKAVKRPILGEKSPNNIFAMADYENANAARKLVVMREPIGVLRSMKSRVESGDPYSDVFNGALETNIGMYMTYAIAARRVLQNSADGILVRYEDMGTDPAKVVRTMFSLFGREPEERVIQFVEDGRDREIADRAPMNYRRLNVRTGYEHLSPADVWKVLSFTRDLRATFGYCDKAMSEFGFNMDLKWPNIEVPTTIVPMSGFYQDAGSGILLMKRNGSLIAYVEVARSYVINLEFMSDFPEQIDKEVSLAISINGTQRELVTVSSGSQVLMVTLNIHSDEFTPMGNSGAYVIINLDSSTSYCPIAHTPNGLDVREMSFRLSNWKLCRVASQ